MTNVRCLRFFKVDAVSLAEAEREEPATETDPENQVEQEMIMTPVHEHVLEAANENDNGADVNEILLLMNICPDDIEGDSDDEAYKSDFTDENDY